MHIRVYVKKKSQLYHSKIRIVEQKKILKTATFQGLHQSLCKKKSQLYHFKIQIELKKIKFKTALFQDAHTSGFIFIKSCEKKYIGKSLM